MTDFSKAVFLQLTKNTFRCKTLLSHILLQSLDCTKNLDIGSDLGTRWMRETYFLSCYCVMLFCLHVQ